MHRLAALLAAMCATAAAAQEGGWLIRTHGVATPESPTVRVEVWAWFEHVPRVAELWASGNFDLMAADGRWSTFDCPLPLACGSPHPWIIGNSIKGANVGQIHYPPWGLFGSADNPILVFTADWTADDFTSRAVPVETIAPPPSGVYVFGVYDAAGKSTRLEFGSVHRGHGAIQVTDCYADCDGNGALDIFDFLCFQNAFLSGRPLYPDPYADCDGDGRLTFEDFLCFQNSFLAGCL
jgi:hypothetical protein